MIIVNIKNGLGNQMFQYAFGKMLEWRYGVEVYFDLLREDISEPLITDLDVFSIEPILEFKPASRKVFEPFSVRQYRDNKQYIKYVYYKLRRKYHFNKLITEPCASQYMELIESLNVNKKYYFLGFWQNPRYFEGFESRIRSFFVPVDVSVYQLPVAKEIIASEYDTISLHFRRGDYLTSGFIEPISLAYYYNAIKLISEKLNNPFFYIFTDEPEWVETNFTMQFPHKLVTGNTGKDSYKDILLMSKCKNHIMANSSFSWWGAWLDENPDKIVIAPKKWYATVDRDKYALEITPKEWIRL